MWRNMETYRRQKIGWWRQRTPARPLVHSVGVSLRADDNLTLISTVCEAAQRSLFWTSNGLNELPEVRFEFPFNLIGDHDKQNKGLF